MKKKLLSITLALILCLSMAVPALAAPNGDRGVITCTEVVAPQYEDAGQFSEGLAAVKKGGKWGYIDEEGNVVIPFQYDYAWGFNEGYAIVGTFGDQDVSVGQQGDGYSMELGFIDKDNKFTAFADTQAERNGDDNTTLYQVFSEADSPKNYTYVFHNGVIGLKNFYNVYTIYHTNGARYSLGTSDNWIVGPMNEGLIPMRTIDGMAYIDGEGNIVHFFGYELSDWNESYIVHIASFNQGIAPAIAQWEDSGETKRLSGFIDRNYKWIIEPQYTRYWYQNAYTTQQIFGDTGLAMVCNTAGMYGAIDKTGAAVIPFQYENLMFVSNGMIAFKSGGKWGYMNASTYEVEIPARYENAAGFNSMGLALVYDGSRGYVIDKNGNTVPGADKIDPSSYFETHDNVDIEIVTPEEYVIIEENGKYGFAHIEYLPKLPEKSDMSSWAYEGVVSAIEENLVPTYLQNLYLNSIKREEFCDLIVQAVEEILDTDIETLVQQRTGKSLDSFRKEYPFTDSTSSNVIAANALGIISGRGGGIFDPYATITRQEAASMLMRAAGVLGMDTGKAENVKFADSGDISSWAADAVNYVYKINVMSGVGGNQFGPKGTYSREQSFMTVYRLLLALPGE